MVHSETAHRLRQRGAEAAQSYGVFLRFIMGFQPQPHQQEWIEACQEIGDDPSGQKIVIIAPPGSGKSSAVGVPMSTWMIGKNPERHYALISYADRVAQERSLAVRNIIEHSQPYKFTFPHVEPDYSAWNRASFRIKRRSEGDLHPTFRGAGALAAVVAYRINGLVFDDPMDQKTSMTPQQRQKVWDNYVNAIRTRLTSDAWELCVGTRWSDDDFIGHLLALRHHGAPIWRSIHTAALSGRGRSYWPVEYPKEKLEEIRYNMPALFAVQYQGDTKGGEVQIIKRLSTYDDYEADDEGRVTPEIAKRKDLLMGVGADTALKDRQENDFTVLYTGGLDRNGRVWVTDRVKDHMAIRGIVDTVGELYETWKPFGVWIEDSAAGTPAVSTIMDEMPYVPCSTVYYGGGKRSRAHVLAQHIHSGQVVFPQFAPWVKDCEHELTHFPFTAHDDDVDALFILVDNLLNTVHPARYEEERGRARLMMR